MRLELDRNESLSVVREGHLLVEIDSTGGVVDGKALEAEVKAARVASVLVRELRTVDDWNAFVDGVNGVLRSHSQPGVPGFVAPPHDSKANAKEYERSWHAGEFVRRFLVDDQLNLFEGDAA